jgi:phenylalanyl-tRNA synthetase beta chain
MKVLLSWLARFAPFEGDPVALGDELSDLGLAVESLERVGEGLDGIVVAEVLALRPHPDADRVQLVDVDRGDGEALQIVCGAFNMAVGDRVPLATLGTTMPGGMEIARRKLRGEVSNGMLCAAAELGLDAAADGILVLGPDAPLGAPVADVLGLVPDVLYDLEVNPNRPDALSVAGVARDLAARLRVPFAIPEPAVVEAGGAGSTADLVRVEVVDPDLCGRFVARVLRGVRVGPSPAWLAARLRACGIRPVNNVVDASNLVMLELGQPNHAFDLATVSGGGLRVRWARDGELLTTLDGVERRLGPSDGVVADADDVAISLAGVMGGASTEISEGTTDVLLELAWWQPMAIARTSKRLGLRSEASMRFERGTDPQVLDLAAARFAELLLADGPGELVAGTVDVRGRLPAPTEVRVRTDRVNRLLGTALGAAEVAELLEPIGFRCEPDPADGGDAAEGATQLVTVPSFRPDTATETDVIEEVARHHGYGRIPATVPRLAQVGSLTTRQAERRLVRQVLVGLGFDEAMPMPFLAPGDLDRAGCPPDAVTITNPLAAEESVLRTSLRPGLLATIAYNASHRAERVELFEVGKVFLPPVAGEVLPTEPEVLGVALAGRDATAAVQAWWVLADALWVTGVALDQVAVAGLHPTRSARLVAGDQVLGAVGEVDPAVVEAYGIGGRVAWLEVDLDALLARDRPAPRYRAVSRYPSSDVDLAFEVPEAIPAATVEAVIVAAGGDLLAGVRLFDVFRGGNLADGVRSLAFSLRLQAADRTLTDDEVAEVGRRVAAAVADQVGGRLRS